MNYNVYLENYFAANNYLDIPESEVTLIVKEYDNYLKIDQKIYAVTNQYKYQLAIFENKGEMNSEVLWDYCLENRLFEYCYSSPKDGPIVISPHYLKFFGDECTDLFVHKKLLPF